MREKNILENFNIQFYFKSKLNAKMIKKVKV